MLRSCVLALIIIFPIQLLAATKQEQKAEGGQSSGGGGPGLVCKDSAGTITSVELFDLYEGRRQGGLDYPDYQGESKDIIYRLIEHFHFDELIQRDLKRTVERIMSKWTPSSDEMEVGTDLGISEVIVKKGCELKLIGAFLRPEYAAYSLVVDMDLYSRLSPLGQAAFILHEAIYLLAFERTQAKNSKEVRALVAAIAAHADASELQAKSWLIKWPAQYKVVADSREYRDLAVHIDNHSTSESVSLRFENCSMKDTVFKNFIWHFSDLFQPSSSKTYRLSPDTQYCEVMKITAKNPLGLYTISIDSQTVASGSLEEDLRFALYLN